MKSMFIFALFHLIGGTAFGIGLIGFVVNLLCYLSSKSLLFSNAMLLSITITGLIIEFVGFVFAIMKLKK